MLNLRTDSDLHSVDDEIHVHRILSNKDVGTATSLPFLATRSPDVFGSSSTSWEEEGSSHQAILGSDEFTPGPFDVICGRGAKAWNHSGNKRFRALVNKTAEDAYSRANSRAERSAIVLDIIGKTRSEGNGFIKQDETTGIWCEVEDLLAREKIGQMLRNRLSSMYRSSMASKSKRRRGMHVRRVEILHGVMKSNRYIHKSMVMMKECSQHKSWSDDDLMAMFNEQQQNILGQTKRKSLVNKFLQAEITACLVMNDDIDSNGKEEEEL